MVFQVSQEQSVVLPRQSDKDVIKTFIFDKNNRIRRRIPYLVFLFVFVVFLLQAPGREVFDTKLDLIVNPVGLMASLWHLWNDSRYFGVLQDQYIGYAWPMGSFFVLMHEMAIPMWIAQRLWMSLTFLAGFWGMARFLEELRVGRPYQRLSGAFLFALWPVFTTLIGSSSFALMPGMLVPLMMVPIMRAARGDSPIKSAMLAGLVVFSMGGINATSTLINMVVPVAYFLTRAPGPRKRAMIKWSVLALILAISWWLLPLLFLGGYGFNFLPYVEQAHTTFSTMSATEALRGAGNWTAYLNFGYLPHSDIVVLSGGGNPNPNINFAHPWIQSGWIVATFPLLILCSCIFAGMGLAGLARRDLPERTFMLIILVFTSVFILSGYWGPLGGPLSPIIQRLFDGPVAPLRNIYKAQPALALSLIVGFVHISSKFSAYAKQRFFKFNSRKIGKYLGILLIAAMLPLATPYLTGRVLQGGSFQSVPQYWVQLTNYIAKYSPESPALVLPATSQAIYVWGTTVDEPLEPLSKSPWSALDQVPYGGPGSRNLLDEIESSFRFDDPPTDLTNYIVRAGITYLVIRNDLDWQASDSPSPAIVHDVLARLGYVQVASFGPSIPSQDFLTASLDGTTPINPPKYPALEVYAPLSLLSGTIPVYPVNIFNADRVVALSGTAGSLASAISSGLVTNDQPAILAGDLPKNITPSEWIDTDGNRRRQIDFGLLNQNSSYTLTAGEMAPLGSPGGEGGLPPHQILPYPPDSHQTVADFSGIKNVTASSYGNWYFSLPYEGPYAALDNNQSTAWVTGDANSVVGQWIKIDLAAPKFINKLSVNMLDDGAPGRPVAEQLEVETNNGEALTNIANTNSSQTLNVPPGNTTFVKIVITKASNFTPGGPGVGIREINIPGIHAIRYLEVPYDLSQLKIPVQAFQFTNNVPNPALTNITSAQQMNRIFYASNSNNFELYGNAWPEPSPQLLNLLAVNSQVRITASSTYNNLGRFYIGNIIYPQSGYSWLAGSKHPTITISWNKPEKINTIDFNFLGTFAARPLSIRIDSPNGTRFASISSDGAANFEPLTTNQITLSFPKIQKIISINQLTGYLSPLPVGLRSISIPKLTNLVGQTPPIDDPINIPCGQGPTITIDGKTYQTKLSGTREDILLNHPMNLGICGTILVPIHGGKNVLTTSSGNSSFVIGSLTLAPESAISSPSPAIVPSPYRTLRVISYGPESRSFFVGPGSTAIVVIHENYANGWHATFNGQSVPEIRVDGWEQGYIIPASQSGVLAINYPPNFLYRLGLLAGFAAILALIVIGILSLFGILRGAETTARAITARPLSPIFRFAAIFIAAFFIGGPMVVIVPIVSMLSYHFYKYVSGDPKFSDDDVDRIPLYPLLCFTLMLLAGIVSAGFPGLSAYSPGGSFGYIAQFLAISAIICALCPPINLLNKSTWTEPIEKIRVKLNSLGISEKISRPDTYI